MSLSDPASSLSFGGVLKSALLAGIVAALIVAAFHFVITEPVIEQAIAIEELSDPGHSMEPAPVSREVQRVGLFVGFVLYGLTWALFYSVAFQLTRGRFNSSSLRKHSYVLAAAACWGVALLPFLKYPANPPGVGEPESIAFRQTAYVGMLALSVAGVIVAAIVGRLVAQRTRNALAPWLAGIAVLAVYSGIIFALMPGNPDPIKIPVWMVDGFRVRSAAGLVLFWILMGGAFAFFAQRSAQPRTAAAPRTA